MAADPTASLQSSLADLREERDGLEDRRRQLDEAIAGVEAAIAALGGRSAAAPAPASSSAAKPKPTPKPRRKAPAGPKVTSDALVAAITAAGGQATTAELVDRLGVSDGRNLNGARRQAVDDGAIVVDDGTYRLAEAGATAAAGPADPPAEQGGLSDEEWEASTAPREPAGDGDGDTSLGRRIP